MLLAPLPDALDIFRPSKVVFVLRLARPPPLARRFRCSPTFRLPAVALPPVITRIADVLFPAMQAVECRFRFHRLAQIEPPNLRKKSASTKKIHTPDTPEENEEQNQGRRALCEAFEENARRKVSGFQTGQITRLSDRRSQRLARLKGKELIRILEGFGFEVIRIRGATIPCATRMGDIPLSLFTPEK